MRFGLVVLDVEIESSSGNRNLDREAQKAARRWRFNPAVQGGQKVASRVRVTRGPSGSFEARFVTAGSGRFVARATNPTGERCSAQASMA